MGVSMGAPQTYEWAVRYPEMVKRAAPIAATPKVTPHEFVFCETCEAHQMLIPNSELRVIHSLWGHNGLLGADPEYVKQIEDNLSELLAAST